MDFKKVQRILESSLALSIVSAIHVFYLVITGVRFDNLLIALFVVVGVVWYFWVKVHWQKSILLFPLLALTIGLVIMIAYHVEPEGFSVFGKVVGTGSILGCGLAGLIIIILNHLR